MVDSNIKIVSEFMENMGPTKDDLFSSFDKYLAENAVWENVGLITTNGIAEAKNFLNSFPGGVSRIDVDMLHIAAIGNVVLTERVDYLFDDEGKLVATLRLAGVFEIEGGRVAKWRDYFDTAPFKPA